MLVTAIIWDAFWFQTLLRAHVKENKHDFEERRNSFSRNGALAVKLPKELGGSLSFQIFKTWLDKILNNLI